MLNLGSRILYLDVETSPLVCLAWGLWQVNIAKLLEDTYILSVAYQWEGERIQFIRSKSRQDDEYLCKSIHNLFSRADIIIAQNGDSFDIKRINARLAYWKLPPPPSYKTIDTLKILKKQFGLTKNSLDFVCQYFGLGKKVEHKGIDLWDNCMRDPGHKDWKTMEKYNKHDVILLRLLWLKIKPWHKTQPNTGRCLKCDGVEGQKRGIVWSRGVKYIRWVCNSCGKGNRLDIKT